jgi:hypothetical protein
MKSRSMRKRIAVSVIAPIAGALLLLVFAHNPVSGAALAMPQGPSTEVVFGKLKAFDHKSGWFSISLPENWTINDAGNADEAIVQVSDPTKNAALILRASPSKALSQPEMGVAVKKYVQDMLGTVPNFTIGDPTGVEDGSVGVVFHFTQSTNNQTFKMYGLAVMKQNNGIRGLLLFVLPQDQYDAKSSAAYEMIGTFRVTEKPKT